MKGCRRVLSVRLTIIIIVSSILAFGLFCLMVWRMLATLHDRREFAKFEQEREKAKWETVRLISKDKLIFIDGDMFLFIFSRMLIHSIDKRLSNIKIRRIVVTK